MSGVRVGMTADHMPSSSLLIGSVMPVSMLTSTFCALGMRRRKVMVRSECTSGDNGGAVDAEQTLIRIKAERRKGNRFIKSSNGQPGCVSLSRTRMQLLVDAHGGRRR